MPNVSKRVLHKLTFALRVNSVEKPNISVNFSNSIHNNSGVTVPEVLQSNWIVEFCIHEIIVKFWAFWLFWEGLKRFCYESLITLMLGQNQNVDEILIFSVAPHQLNFLLHVALWLVEKMTDILKKSLISQQLTSLPATGLLEIFHMSRFGCFDDDTVIKFSQKTKMCLIIPYVRKRKS